MSLNLVNQLIGHKNRVWSAKWGKCGKKLASCSADKNIRIWSDDGSGKYRCEFVLSEGHKRSIRNIAWSKDGRFIASCSFDSTTCIWDRESEWQCLVNLEGPDNEVKCAAWSPSGKYLATCSRDKTVWIWEKIDDGDYECASVLSTHTQDVKKVIWHPIDDVLVSCSFDNTIRFHREQGDDFMTYLVLDQHESTVWSLDFNATGDKMVSCSDDQTVRIWSLDSTKKDHWSLMSTLSGYHSGAIYDVSWSKHDNLIATASRDNSIAIFKPSSDPTQATYELLTRKYDAHSNDVNSVEWNPVIPRLLASGGDDNIVNIWRVACE